MLSSSFVSEEDGEKRSSDVILNSHDPEWLNSVLEPPPPLQAETTEQMLQARVHYLEAALAMSQFQRDEAVNEAKRAKQQVEDVSKEFEKLRVISTREVAEILHERAQYERQNAQLREIYHLLTCEAHKSKFLQDSLFAIQDLLRLFFHDDFSKRAALCYLLQQKSEPGAEFENSLIEILTNLQAIKHMFDENVNYIRQKENVLNPIPTQIANQDEKSSQTKTPAEDATPLRMNIYQYHQGYTPRFVALGDPTPETLPAMRSQAKPPASLHL